MDRGSFRRQDLAPRSRAGGAFEHEPGARRRASPRSEDLYGQLHLRWRGPSGDITIGDRIVGNSIFLNTSQGIDLGADGHTDNDVDDLDAGPTLRQNFPVLASAKAGRDGTILKGRLNSTPGRTFTVQFFSNPPATDEGKTFLGQKSVTTDADGDAAISFRTRKRAAGSVTATATDPAGNTSEFSEPRTVSRRR